ncbi:MAG TPA: hypothetical protein VNA16_01510 [Abditibacteriaceae bacterium]|nr:hypothetical protein [Abditibacteriaceae bacterium]
MIDIHEKAQQVYEQGFCVLEAVYDVGEIREASTLLDGYWEQQGRPPMSDFGIGIHPLAAKVPEIMPYFGRQIVIDVMEAVVRDKVHLVHTGARLSNVDSAAAIGWHNHYSWDKNRLPRRDTIERILAGVYLEGSHPAIGPLVVLPRRYNDPLSEPAGEYTEDWPGQLEVAAPPGSVVVFDTALWHTAKRGASPRVRHLFGAHYQGWSNPAAHPEDNPCDGAQIEPYKRTNAVLRSLLESPVRSAA